MIVWTPGELKVSLQLFFLTNSFKKECSLQYKLFALQVTYITMSTVGEILPWAISSTSKNLVCWWSEQAERCTLTNWLSRATWHISNMGGCRLQLRLKPTMQYFVKLFKNLHNFTPNGTAGWQGQTYSAMIYKHNTTQHNTTQHNTIRQRNEKRTI